MKYVVKILTMEITRKMLWGVKKILGVSNYYDDYCV